MAKRGAPRSPDQSHHIHELLLLGALRLLITLFTLPYYRFFQFNTMKPIRRIAECTSDPSQGPRLLRLIAHWRAQKMGELHFISIACAILVGAVIGTFSWANISTAYWLAPALWYCSIVFSVLGILIATQQIAVLEILGPPPSPTGTGPARKKIKHFLPLLLCQVNQNSGEADLPVDAESIGRWRPKWKMIFTWQCPIMFMSYSVSLYMVGLTIFVCSPLIEREWNTDAYIALIYLGICAITACIFVTCSFWLYRYVDLEEATEFFTEEEEAERGKEDKSTQTLGLKAA